MGASGLESRRRRNAAHRNLVQAAYGFRSGESSLTQALVNELSPARSRATYMAALSVVNDVKDAAGPAVGTWLYALSAVLPWAAGIPVTLGASLVLALAVRRQETGRGTAPK